MYEQLIERLNAGVGVGRVVTSNTGESYTWEDPTVAPSPVPNSSAEESYNYGDPYWVEYCKTAPLQDWCNPASPCWVDEATCKAKGGGTLVSQFKEYETGDSCSAEHTIRAVQLATGNPNVDGTWGPESQKYLDASGMAYTDIVPGCTGAIPSYVVPTDKPPPTGNNTNIVIDTTDTEQKTLYLGLPLWAWLVIGGATLVVGGTGAYFAFRKEDKSDTGVGSRELAMAEPRARAKRMRRKVSKPRNSKGQFVSKKLRYSR